MNRKLKKRIPNIPHWRYIFSIGPEHPDFDDQFYMLENFVDQEKIDLGIDETNEEEFEEAMELWESPPIRKVIEFMILEKCPNSVICDALYYKFNIEPSNRSLTLYKKFFFDIYNIYDFAKYCESQGVQLHMPPPVPGHMRSEYANYKMGGKTNINPDEAMQDLFADAYFRSKELQQYGWAGDKKVMQYQKITMQAYKAIKENNISNVDEEEFKYEVEWPSETAVESLEGFDEDRNHHGKE